MAGVAPVIPKFQFCNALGVPMVGGGVQVYLAGTVTPSNTWQNSDLSTLNTNPIVLDSRGECVMWLDSALTYKFVVSNSLGVEQFTVDNVSGATNSGAVISFIQAGTGAVSRSAQDKMRDFLTPEDFGAEGDGTTDDYSAMLAAFVASAAQNKPVDLRGKTYLIGTALALTSAHNNLKVVGHGGTLKKGFNGTLMTLTDTANFAAWDIKFEGQHGTYTGKGVVFSGSSSVYPSLFGCEWSAFTDTALEFGADAGHGAAIIGCWHNLGSGQTDPRVVHMTGTDTGAAIRRIVGCSFEGYIQLAAAQDVYITSSQFTRTETDATCSNIFIQGCRWGNAGSAMTLSGYCLVTGNSYSGDVTLTANFSGSYVGNVQTSGTFTNSSTAGNALVVHHELSAAYENIGRHRLRAVSTAALIASWRTASGGDASQTFTPGGAAPHQRFATTLTAERTVTLSDTAIDGDVCLVSRPAGGDFYLKVARANAFVLTSLLQNDWGYFQYDGSNWNQIAGGTLTGGVKTITRNTAVGNVGAGEDDLISVTTFAAAIGIGLGDAYSVPRGIRIHAWGTYANNANAKAVKLYFGGTAILTFDLTISQSGNWDISAEVSSVANNSQKYASRLLQSGTATGMDVEVGTLAITDSAAITIKCTGTATSNDDIVQEGLTVSFVS